MPARTLLCVAMALALASSAGCGSSSGDESSKFIGSWQPVALAQTAACDDGSGGTQALTAVITITDAAGTDVVVHTGACNWTLAVSGADAVLAPGQICNTSDSNGDALAVTPQSYVFTTADGKNATIAATEDVATSTLGCTRVVAGTLTRPR